MATWNPRVSDLFLMALEIADSLARSAMLDKACGSNLELRAQVNALLTASERAGSFLVEPAVAAVFAASGGPARTYAHDPPEGIGTIIAGRYKLIEAIGEGGMGSVYVAQQTDPVRRLVALKVIKAGMDSRQVLTRFEAERQALALMEHPNIAKVFDAGATDANHPFFVMELIKGVTITEFCDQRHLSPRQRLELFIPVCHAIQHAHQKGVIHRDIKPNNVLVALYDGKPVPKVIDFGIAKTAGQPLTDRTLVTGFGAVVGTPEYMSPEQAELNQIDIDTRSDVFALGVLLYELLTGTTPLDRKRLGKAALLEILRLVREEEPPRPSTRLSTSDALPAIAANRGTETALLARLMRGDLDLIVMKALEKDRSRRYETASGLARDVQRYLADEAVEARSPSVRYKLGRLIRRNRAATLTAAAMLLVLIGGIVGTTWGLVRAEHALEAEAEARQHETQRAEAELDQRKRAEAAELQAREERNRAAQEARVSRTVRDFLQNKLLGQASAINQADALQRASGSATGVRPNPTVRELLDRADNELTPDKIESQFPGQPWRPSRIETLLANCRFWEG